ncbi:CAF17-like 4Fe-4S cluster assembly/insertion protein YgfZ [Advenella alkanexedens]|uniref:CAF17-like 4Fe-4S cluster assembly/insertion protein YgfZ n=1 Tax=Advenella alkanexedens TaxID=1481665 RepID=UPI0026758A24|nr:folate-binding protein [Advenella alkanexedens]WKU18375.1 folate-binding protein [Advenella alkanexedens]
MISEPQEPIDDTLFQSDLTHFTAFSVSGADATNFLQGQLTQDMTLATENHAVLSAYCSPKGRVLASFLIWKEVQADNEEIFRFLVRNNIAEPMIKRLRMFVMRSKVVFTPETLSIKGIWSTSIEALGKRLALDLQQMPAWQVTSKDGCTWIALPDVAGNKRFICVYDAQTRDQECFCSLLSHKDTAQWDAMEILSGTPWIEKGNQELFIAQSINFDVINGISFTKGCYPGQEVVARSHYRGTLKRRMAIGIVANATDPEIWQPGKDVFDAQDTNEPCGQIVNSTAYDGKVYLLFETKLSALEHNQINIGSLEGPKVELVEIPYSLEKPEIRK